jgi:DNA-binding transcriptional ArsR family regulator
MDTTRIQNQLEIHVVPIKKTILVLRAINHPLRQQMLKLIHEESKITVTELYDTLGLEQSVASQHLAILRRAGWC